MPVEGSLRKREKFSEMTKKMALTKTEEEVDLPTLGNEEKESV